MLSFELETTKVPARVVGLFAKQLGLLLASGVNLVDALEILSVQEEYPAFGEIIKVLAQKIVQGNSLSQAMTFFPLVFPSTLRAMVKVGEQTGDVAGDLCLAGDWMERDFALYSKLKSTLAYPIFVTLIAITLTILLFTTVVPQFLVFLHSSHIEPPMPTVVVMMIANLLLNPGTYIFLVGVIGFLWIFWTREKAVTERAADWTRRLYRIPVVGHLCRSAALARFVISGATLLKQGTPLTRTVELAARASNSPLLIEDAERVVEEIENGETWADAMGSQQEIYGNRLVQFVAAGEESAKLSKMLTSSGALFQLELELAVERIPSLLEPLLLSTLGAMVALVLLSLFLPLYSAIGGVA